MLFKELEGDAKQAYDTAASICWEEAQRRTGLTLDNLLFRDWFNPEDFGLKTFSISGGPGNAVFKHIVPEISFYFVTGIAFTGNFDKVDYITVHGPSNYLYNGFTNNQRIYHSSFAITVFENKPIEIRIHTIGKVKNLNVTPLGGVVTPRGNLEKIHPIPSEKNVKPLKINKVELENYERIVEV